MLDTHIVGFGDSEKTQKAASHKTKKKSGGFQSFGLSYPVLKGIQKRGYKVPTPIQRKSIPLIIEGRDVVAMARTGSGKTACFLIPMLEKLSSGSKKATSGPRAVILSPTRELALQTHRFVNEMGRFTNLKCTTILGGDSMDQQFGAIHGNPDIIVATPGRFLHLCVEMDLKLNSLEYVVFDEADRLFEMGLGEQLQDIIDRLPDGRQTLLFSATLPKILVDFAKVGLTDPILLRLDVESKLPDLLSLEFFCVRQEDKPSALLNLLHVLPARSQTIVFAATKHHVEYLHLVLDRAGVTNTFIYSDLDPAARKINAAKFANRNCSVLIVTDIAARGVDLPYLDYVVNYHFPAKAKLFVHRVGRCARAGRSGTAFSLVSAEEGAYVLDLHLFLGRPLNILKANTKDSDMPGALGRIPDGLIEAEQSQMIAWQENSVDLENMVQVCKNAYRKYLVSRPAASAESVKRLKEIDLSNLRVHPFFAKIENDNGEVSKLLSKMKAYKPKGTIFELNVSAKSKSYSIMKTTKKAHEQQILKFRQSRPVEEIEAPKEEEEEAGKFVKLRASNETDITETFQKIIGGKRKRGQENGGGKYQDAEYYVPHQAADRHSEAGLAVNSFAEQATKAAFELTADCEEAMRANKKMKKWDAVKKKMVGPSNDKVKKIKTESGNWIAATYKSNRYAQWKEKSKVQDEDSDESGGDEKPQNIKSTFENTRWGQHNRKMAEKIKKKSQMKRPEQILKARKVLENKRQKSMARDKKKKFKQRKNFKKF